MKVDEMTAKMLDNLPEKTGKSLAEWKKVLAKMNFEKHMQAVNFLKKEHGVTHGFANLIVHMSKDNATVNTDDGDLVENQYAGKEHLREFYEKLKSEISGFGKDIEFSPKKAYVSVRRKKQFAIIQPSTKKRLDLGLNIKNSDPGDVLEKAGSWNSMCTHRIRIESADDITADVSKWLKVAYDEAG